MNIIDIVLIVIIILYVLLGLKKGLLRSAVEFAGFILAVPAALYGAKALAPILYQNLFHQKLIDNTLTKVDGYGDIASFVAGLQDTLASLPFSLDTLGQKFGFDINGMLSEMTSGLTNATVSEQYVNSFLKPIVTMVCTGVLFLLFFLILVVLIKVVSFLLKNSHLPHGLKELNGSLGAVFGLLKGAVVVFVVCTIFGVAQMGLSLKTEPSEFAAKIESSFIVEKVNQLNPLFQ